MNEKNTFIQKIEIKYSIDLETQRIFSMIKKIEWLNKMGYKIDLPKKMESMDLDKVNKMTKKDIKRIVSEEYNVQDYQKIKSIIEKEWSNVSTKLSRNLLTINLEYEPLYILVLTKYGTSGSYNLPNEIILNFTKKTLDNLIRTIVHEIIHLSIQPLIEKFGINHWSKERMVDLIMVKTMPELSKMQSLPQNKGIDRLFDKFFPDIEKIIRKCAKLEVFK